MKPDPTTATATAVRESTDDATAKARKRKPDGLVWDAWDANQNEVLRGFLVTDADDPAQLIAWCENEHDGPSNTDTQRQLARDIAADLQLLDGTDQRLIEAWDLRGYCRIDSPRPTPALFYALQISPEGKGGRDLESSLPFCRFRLAKMVAAHNRQRFTAEDRRREYTDVIGISDGPTWNSNGNTVHDTTIDPAHVPL